MQQFHVTTRLWLRENGRGKEARESKMPRWDGLPDMGNGFTGACPHRRCSHTVTREEKKERTRALCGTRRPSRWIVQPSHELLSTLKGVHNSGTGCWATSNAFRHGIFGWEKGLLAAMRLLSDPTSETLHCPRATKAVVDLEAFGCQDTLEPVSKRQRLTDQDPNAESLSPRFVLSSSGDEISRRGKRSRVI